MLDTPTPLSTTDHLCVQRSYTHTRHARCTHTPPESDCNLLRAGKFLVDAKGATLANLNDQGYYYAELIAVDGAAVEVTVLQWDFQVKQRNRFQTKPDLKWSPQIEAELAGMQSRYTHMHMYAPLSPYIRVLSLSLKNVHLCPCRLHGYTA